MDLKERGTSLPKVKKQKQREAEKLEEIKKKTDRRFVDLEPSKPIPDNGNRRV